MTRQMGLVVPVLTLIIGGLLGHLAALIQTRRRIAAEKRAEYVSGFVALAYEGLGALLTATPTPLGELKQRLSILGEQAAFFVDDRAARAIRDVTTRFAAAVQHESDRRAGIPATGGDKAETWRDFRTHLEATKALLQRHLAANR